MLFFSFCYQKLLVSYKHFYGQNILLSGYETTQKAHFVNTLSINFVTGISQLVTLCDMNLSLEVKMVIKIPEMCLKCYYIHKVDYMPLLLDQK